MLKQHKPGGEGLLPVPKLALLEAAVYLRPTRNKRVLEF